MESSNASQEELNSQEIMAQSLEIPQPKNRPSPSILARDILKQMENMMNKIQGLTMEIQGLRMETRKTQQELRMELIQVRQMINQPRNLTPLIHWNPPRNDTPPNNLNFPNNSIRPIHWSYPNNVTQPIDWNFRGNIIPPIRFNVSRSDTPPIHLNLPRSYTQSIHPRNDSPLIHWNSPVNITSSINSPSLDTLYSTTSLHQQGPNHLVSQEIRSQSANIIRSPGSIRKNINPLTRNLPPQVTTQVEQENETMAIINPIHPLQHPTNSSTTAAILQISQFSPLINL